MNKFKIFILIFHEIYWIFFLSLIYPTLVQFRKHDRYVNGDEEMFDYLPFPL